MRTAPPMMMWSYKTKILIEFGNSINKYIHLIKAETQAKIYMRLINQELLIE